MHIYNNVNETVGNTPLVRVNRLNDGGAEILAKLEYFNPLGCVKERIALAMIDAAETEGAIGPDTVIVEPTSGNTGIGLAMVCAVKGYRLILTMPETMSVERRKLLKALGAHIILTEGSRGMSGAVARAEALLKEIPHAYMPQQFNNPVNADIHRRTTAQEILRDTNKQLDFFVAGVGTGGTLSGVGEVLKKECNASIVAVEPAASPLLSEGRAGTHRIQGIGAGFVPEVLNRDIIDIIMPVTDTDAGETARAAARLDGMLCGISGGAALFAARELSRNPANAGKRIIVLIPDTGERYLSTWLFEE